MRHYLQHIRDSLKHPYSRQISLNQLTADEYTRSEVISSKNSRIVLTGLVGGAVSLKHASRETGNAPDYHLTVYTKTSRCVKTSGTDYRQKPWHGFKRAEDGLARGSSTLTDKRVGVFFDRWMGNYYHWMLYCIPKIVLLNRFFQVDHFFLPSGLYSMPAFVMESIDLLGLNRCMLIPIYPGLHRASELCIADGASPSPLAWKLTRENFLAMSKGIKKCDARIVYLTRKSNLRAQRVLTNEDEVLSMCERKGIQVVDPGSLSLTDQISLFNSIRLVISMHGAALTNIIWMEPGGKVIEISTGSQPHYMSLAENLSHEWFSILAKKVDSVLGSHNGEFVVNVPLLESMIDSIA